MPSLFEFARQCNNPALAKQQLLDWVIFNLAVFNFDAHGKNVSFFVDPNGLTLAPFYDLVNVKMYPEFEHEMAMGLGDEFDGNVVNAYQLADFAESCHLSKALLAGRVHNLAKKLIMALNGNISQVTNNNQEKEYLALYRTVVLERCQHLLEQVNDITDIEV